MFLPFTGGQKLRPAGHTSNETHSLDSRSVRGPPLDAGAKVQNNGKRSNDMPLRCSLTRTYRGVNAAESKSKYVLKTSGPGEVRSK